MKKYISILAIVLGVFLLPKFSLAGYISQTDFSQQSEAPSWSTKVALIQAIDLSGIASSSVIQFYFKGNDSFVPLFNLNQGGWSDISELNGVSIANYTDGNTTTTLITISSSTLINTIANYTTALYFYICNDSGSCQYRRMFGTNQTTSFSNPFWFNNTGGNTHGNDTNLTSIYFQILTDNNIQNGGETIPTSTYTGNYDFNSVTSTPGFNFNATTSQGWIDSIWTSTSSAFYVDCSGNDGGFFTSSTLNAIGCQFQRIGMGVLGMFVSPMPFVNNYLSASFLKIQNVFPFSMVFSTQNVLKNNIASSTSESASSLSFPTNTPLGTITVLTSSTLENAVGASTKSQIFDALNFLMWLGTGVIIITLI